jgi:hypothetical protein
MSKLNLPPFYVGQKVEYVGWKSTLKGTKHIILDCFMSECGCWMVKTENLPNGTYYICDCGAVICLIGKFGQAKSFRPLQQQKFPLIKLSKIMEKEKEEILIEN